MNNTVKMAYEALTMVFRTNYKSSMAYRGTPARLHKPRRRVIQNWVYGANYGKFRRGMYTNGPFPEKQEPQEHIGRCL